jgi:hypothetical protein
MILKSGYIEGFKYPVNTDKISQDKEQDYPEIATVRPTVPTNKVIELSSNAGKIRIVIEVHKLLDKVRNIKVSPIAEYPIASIEELDLVFRNIFHDKKLRRQKIKEFMKFVSGKIDNFNKLTYIDFFRIIQKWYEKENIMDLGEEFNPLIFNSLRKYFRFIKRREGEERIIIGKNNGWKQKTKLGKVNNQNFQYIPFSIYIFFKTTMPINMIFIYVCNYSNIWRYLRLSHTI